MREVFVVSTRSLYQIECGLQYVETATLQQRQMLMGHRDNEPMGFYISGLVGIDSQNIVRGRPQRAGLLEQHISMMAKRNLFAPTPPGSQLTELVHKAPIPAEVDVMEVTTLTSSEHYEIRRQSRNKAYRKKREEFFEEGGIAPAETVSVPQRLPSRYLKALWKFDRDREAISNLMFPDGKVDVGVAVPLETIIIPMASAARPGRRRYAYKDAEPSADSHCSVCEKKLDPYVYSHYNRLSISLTAPRKRPARMNIHLLQCARQRLVKKEREHMTAQFNYKETCQWHDCSFRFRGKTCGSNSIHVTEHIKLMQSKQCLWNNCFQLFDSYETLAYHLSAQHGVPNAWTILTKMHYCYEHDLWCRSEQQWVQHIKMEHFLRLNDFCGLIRQAGVVVVAAHCLFCLGDVSLPVESRFVQFHDTFVLHKHMKQHLLEQSKPLSVCPHPHCEDQLGSESAFWEHANSVHGSPLPGPVPEKRKTSDYEGADSSKRCRVGEQPSGSDILEGECRG
jgi:hypothetical protein